MGGELFSDDDDDHVDDNYDDEEDTYREDDHNKDNHNKHNHNKDNHDKTTITKTITTRIDRKEEEKICISNKNKFIYPKDPQIVPYPLAKFEILSRLNELDLCGFFKTE